MVDLAASGAECWVCVGEVRDPETARILEEANRALRQSLAAYRGLIERFVDATADRIAAFGPLTSYKPDGRIRKGSGTLVVVAEDLPVRLVQHGQIGAGLWDYVRNDDVADVDHAQPRAGAWIAPACDTDHRGSGAVSPFRAATQPLEDPDVLLQRHRVLAGGGARQEA